MRILILAVGSRGDVQPCIAIGRALKARGHQVRFLTHGNFRDAIEGLGLGFLEAHGNPREWLESEPGLCWLESGLNPFAFFRGLKRFMRLVLANLPKTLEFYKDCDAILYTPLAIAGPHLGEKLGCPAFPLMFQPVYPTSAFPSFLLDPQGTAPRARAQNWFARNYNCLSYHVVEQGFNLVVRKQINGWRCSDLRLGSGAFFGEIARQRQRRVPHFLGWSEHVLPRPQEWTSQVHATGYWYLPPPETWQPPADLMAFLEQGPPPVYVGFGSLTLRNASNISDLVIKALGQAGCRGILSRGWGNLGQGAPSQSIFQIDSVPHEWLFPKLAAIVHHGGAGTTGASLRSGAPSVLVPFFCDQFLWANRVAELNAGPKAVPYAGLTVEKLAGAIRQSLTDPRLKERPAKSEAKCCTKTARPI